MFFCFVMFTLFDREGNYIMGKLIFLGSSFIHSVIYSKDCRKPFIQNFFLPEYKGWFARCSETVRLPFLRLVRLCSVGVVG